MDVKFNMPCKCHDLCNSLPEAINGRMGGRFNTHNWCKTCEKWLPKPTPIRCKCCNQKFRTMVRCSKVKMTQEFKRY